MDDLSCPEPEVSDRELTVMSLLGLAGAVMWATILAVAGVLPGCLNAAGGAADAASGARTTAAVVFYVGALAVTGAWLGNVLPERRR